MNEDNKKTGDFFNLLLKINERNKQTIIESEFPPLKFDEKTKWKNTKNGQIYRPHLNGAAWHSNEGSIYPFLKGTKFTHYPFPEMKMILEI